MFKELASRGPKHDTPVADNDDELKRIAALLAMLQNDLNGFKNDVGQ
jgi:hypothetical protein